MKTKFYFIFVLCASLGISIGYSQVQTFDVCESLTGWSWRGSDIITVDNANFKEGAGSLTATGRQTVRFQKDLATTFNTGVTKDDGYLSLWLYIDNVNLVNFSSGQIEITSAGLADHQELNWAFSAINNKTPITSGWNRLLLKLSEATEALGTNLAYKGSIDLTAINFFRVHLASATSTVGSVTIKIDNIQFAENPVLLPVELSKYKASLQNNSVKIGWETTSESNSSHFEVLSSSNGTNFSTIGEVKTKGFASKYSIIDPRPVNGQNYYKLLQYDNDGKIKDYGVTSVNFSLANRLRLVVFPNPVLNDFHVKINDYSGKTFDLTLTDFTGRTILTKKVAVDNGSPYYTFQNEKGILNGTYILNVSGEGLNESMKIVFN